MNKPEDMGGDLSHGFFGVASELTEFGKVRKYLVTSFPIQKKIAKIVISVFQWESRKTFILAFFGGLRLTEFGEA